MGTLRSNLNLTVSQYLSTYPPSQNKAVFSFMVKKREPYHRKHKKKKKRFPILILAANRTIPKNVRFPFNCRLKRENGRFLERYGSRFL